MKSSSSQKRLQLPSTRIETCTVAGSSRGCTLTPRTKIETCTVVGSSRGFSLAPVPGQRPAWWRGRLEGAPSASCRRGCNDVITTGQPRAPPTRSPSFEAPDQADAQRKDLPSPSFTPLHTLRRSTAHSRQSDWSYGQCPLPLEQV